MLLRSVVLPVTATSRRDLVERLVQLLVGLFLYGVASGFMVSGGIGVAPWDVLALGLAEQTGLRYGVMTVVVSIVVLLLWIPLRQRVGLGTVLNALLVGPQRRPRTRSDPAARFGVDRRPHVRLRNSCCCPSRPVCTSPQTSVPDPAMD